MASRSRPRNSHDVCAWSLKLVARVGCIFPQHVGVDTVYGWLAGPGAENGWDLLVFA